MTEQRDYKDTVFLPKTDFPMKASLPQKEPHILARWQEEGVYEQLRETRKGREKFILHDGPPYANGDMHIGHALNRILKDMVVRSQTLLGKDAPFVPGWDCHGLPIEWKVEEQYRKKKRDKNQIPPAEFRAECRAYAQHWVDIQRDQLKRLGLMADFDNPYLTMQPESEATIVAELMKFAEAGNLYRGSKPVMWSPVEETALAEAEVEYEDITSTQIDVAFEIVQAGYIAGGFENGDVITPSAAPNAALNKSHRVQDWLTGAKAVVWTTTPWTIPVNQALAYGRQIEYALLESEGEKFLVANDLVSAFLKRVGRTGEVVETIRGSGLFRVEARHPMHHLGGLYAKPRPFLPGDFVTTDSGTGLVHMAPDHGEDDFLLCREYGIDPQFAVVADGRYRDDWLWLGGNDERRRSVINKPFNSAEGPICSDLREAGALLAASDDYLHSYPHSWRSKAKIIYRCTPQWFVPLDKRLGHDRGERSLRNVALSEIDRVQFYPEKGRRRIGAMVESRPDWVLSRQRAWGVPITLFARQDGSYLQDPQVNARIVAAVREDGVDAWDESRKAEFLGPDYDPAEFEMVTDILDVWFDSGCTHAFTLESGRWPDQRWPADLYLEGSDQHRGWFQSSLVESCATRGRAPYDAVLTHGFTMDRQGKKMSKSLGNTIDPRKVMEQYGADIIRLWALSVDFTEDHRIGDEILKGVGDQYRRLRNSFRYLLGALDGFEGDGAIGDIGALPDLERYALSLLADLDGRLKKAVEEYDFNTYTRLLVDFCNEDLSAFYFDIRKDCLYCDGPDSVKRNAYRAVLDLLFHALVRYAAPVLVFTAEEAWTTRYPQGGSVHLLDWPEIPDVSADNTRWEKLRALRERVNEAIEPLRRDKTIRSSLEADVIVPASAVPEGFTDEDLAELFITASVSRSDNDGVNISRSTECKCGRCWGLLPSVCEDGALCHRCEEVVEYMDANGGAA